MAKKSLIKFSLLGAVILAVIGFTVAYFQDVETSSGNKFTAGKFDLQIDNTCHYNGKICAGGVWEGTEEPCACSWEQNDLSGQLFFNLPDVKPGDYGEDTVSLHVINNNAWVCAEISDLASDDNGCDKPESDVDTTCGAGQGELKENLLFTVWKDTDCDNILDQAEQVLVTDQPPQSGFWPIADSTTGAGPLAGGQTSCLGVSWKVPLSTSNIVQTDSLEGDVKFTAVQSRHMDTFKCSDLYTEVCDGIDNNYNNQIDEGPLWTNLGQTCSSGIGKCQASGTYVCDPQNPSGPAICTAVSGDPSTEICNGLDDNCDGQTDENNPGGGMACSTPLPGICSAGITQCQSGSISCIQNLLPVTETCFDGLDNDCDGLIDEDCQTPNYQLTVNKSGNGTGTVTSSPAGINCGTTCSAAWTSGSTVTLSAVSDGNSIFTGWSGACTGAGGCTITMDAAKTVTASFVLKTYTLSVNVTGGGSVYNDAQTILCGNGMFDCSENFNAGETVTLNAKPNPESVFTGWSGACTGTTSCTVSMSGPKSVSATFLP